MPTYHVYFEGQEQYEVEAEEFRIEEGGVLAFYEYRSETISTDKKPFTAFNDWDEVTEK